MIDQTLTDFIQHLAKPDPYWVNEQSPLQVRVDGLQHFVINEVDAGRLVAIRELILSGKVVCIK